MELLARMEGWPWLISAACDLVALCAAFTVAVLWRTRSMTRTVSMQAEVARNVTPRMEEERPLPASPRNVPLSVEKPARADVSRALAAIGRWENHYGSARGITELARFVDGQKPARERVSA